MLTLRYPPVALAIGGERSWTWREGARVQIVDHPHTTDEGMEHFMDECLDNVFVIRNGKVFDVGNDPGVNWNVDEFYNTYVSVALDEAVWGAAN